jgi:hypothetical protein
VKVDVQVRGLEELKARVGEAERCGTGTAACHSLGGAAHLMVGRSFLGLAATLSCARWPSR